MKTFQHICLFLAAIFQCSLVSTAHAATAIALYDTADGVSYNWCKDEPSLKQAKACALKECGVEAAAKGLKPQACQLLASSAQRMWWAVFHRANGGIGQGQSLDRQTAIDQAYQACIKDGNTCPKTAATVFHDDGPGAAKAPQPSRSEHWTTNCENSDCTRVYDDGRRVHFEACTNPTTGAAFDNPDGSCDGIDMTGRVYGQPMS